MKSEIVISIYKEFGMRYSVYLTVVIVALFSSYMFWYTEPFRSSGIFLISFIGIVELARNRYSLTGLIWHERILFISFLTFSFYHFFRSLLGWEPWSEFDRYSRVMLAIPFGFVLCNLKKINMAYLLRILVFLIVVSLCLKVLHLTQFQKKSVWLIGLNPIQLAYTACTIMLFTYCYILDSEKICKRVMWFLLFLLSLVPVILSLRVSALLLVVLLFIFSLFLAFRLYSFLIFAFSLCVLLLILILYVSLTETVLERRVMASYMSFKTLIPSLVSLFSGDSIMLRNDSISPRLILWQHGFNLVDDNFLFGIGQYELEASYSNSNSNSNFELFRWNPNLHNGFLQEFVVKGYVGFMLFLSIILIPLGYFYDESKNKVTREYRCVAQIGIAVIVVFVVFNLTQVIFGHMNGVLLYSFTVMLIWATLKEINLRTSKLMTD